MFEIFKADSLGVLKTSQNLNSRYLKMDHYILSIFILPMFNFTTVVCQPNNFNSSRLIAYKQKKNGCSKFVNRKKTFTISK